MTPEHDALVARLRRVKSPAVVMRPTSPGHYSGTNAVYFNPDGPEAAQAIAALSAEVARRDNLLLDSLYHLRMDDGAKCYHDKVIALRAALKDQADV